MDCTATTIELASLNCVLFTQSHSGMSRGDELSQVFREATRGDAVEHVIFFTAQETEAALRFWALGDAFCWIVCDLFVVKAEFVRQADERLIPVECGRCFAVHRKDQRTSERRSEIRTQKTSLHRSLRNG